MTVNIEVKGNLAKLLSTENLIIEHKKVDTASFDVQRRVLTLPQWNIDSNFVYDMLVAHEVGHALFTPFRKWNEEEEYKDVPFDYVNVVEDARIERLMKQKYAGLNRDFYKGYEELHTQNFFEVDESELDNLKLIDRVNLYFKVGAYLCFDFNDDENQLITEISQAETFDEVLALSKKLFELSKQQKQQIDQAMQLEVQLKKDSEDIDGTPINISDSEETDEESDTEIEGKTNTEESEDDDFDIDEEPTELSVKAGNHSEIDTSDTQRSFDRNAEQLNDENSRETTYVSIPEVDIDSIQIKFETLRDRLKDHFQFKTPETAPCYHANELDWWNNGLTQSIQEFQEFKKSARKDVNNLVKEFEMKKSADSYSRSATARTGMLDMNKLHTYKYNEDIFKKVTVIPEGKNHGLVFLLDWSGSMQNQLIDTMKQLFNLVWFCRKVQIPFEVYAFTQDSWTLDPRVDENKTGYGNIGTPHTKIVTGELVIPETFRMVNILSSQQRGRDIDEMMKLLWVQSQAMITRILRPLRDFSLSGTPLNEAIIAVGALTKNIIKTRKIQKCHIVVLTDGDGFHSDVWGDTDRWDGQRSKTPIYTSSTAIRVGSKVFSGGHSNNDFTQGLVKAVKSTLPECNFLGIRLLERDLHYFYISYARTAYETVEEMKAQNRKEGMIHFKTDSFDQWYGISCKKLREDDELAVDQGADKRSISTAFKKMNRSKKTNRVMVKQFIDQIA